MATTPATRSRKIFVNLPIRNLKRSVDFFTRLGFTFNPQFTDDKATCMVLSEDGYVMLLVDDRFKDFTKRQLCDSGTHTEGIFALSAESRAEVDELMEKVLAAGGSAAMPTMDLGFMYNRSFYDLDGHHWEVFHMDMSAMPPQQ